VASIADAPELAARLRLASMKIDCVLIPSDRRGQRSVGRVTL